MRTLAADDPVASVSLSVMRAECTKTAERIEVMLGTDTLEDP